MRQGGARLAIAWVLATGSGCASHCRAMEEDRRAFFARRVEPRGPHARVVIPMAVADGILAARLAASPMVATVHVPRVGPLRLEVTRLSLRPAEEDRLGLRVDVAVSDGGASLGDLTAVAVLAPVVDAPAGRLELAVRPGDLRGLSAAPSPAVVERLAAALRARLPPGAALLVPVVVGRLTAELGGLLADSGLLDPLGSVARVAVDIPVVPVTRFTVRSAAAAVEIGIHTALPTAAEVPPAPLAGDRVRVQIAAPAGVEQVNALLASGRIPARYDTEMRAREDGELTPGLRWRGGARPLEIYAWRRGGHCFRARIGARPTLSVDATHLRVGIEDGELEDVDGALLVRARVWSKRVGEDAIAATRDVVSSTRVTVAGVSLSGRIVSARFTGDVVDLELDVTAAPGGT